MTESTKSNWDRKRIETLLHEEIGDPYYIDHGPEGDGHAIDKLVELLGSVRAEAIEWAWTHARNQHARGMNHHKQPIPELLKLANADLNPERENG